VRFFLIDKVTELVPGERARGVKAVTLTDEVLHDHFPGYPVLPGALVVESMAQLAGFLLDMTFNRGEGPLRRALLVQIKQANFHEMCEPGDRLEVEARIASTLEAAAQVEAEVRVGEKRVARALLTFAMKAIPLESIHEQRRAVYRLWTRHFDPPLDIR
jgi:3-hydroxyacyl-[acyl-carrier-protein] dehydratase